MTVAEEGQAGADQGPGGHILAVTPVDALAWQWRQASSGCHGWACVALLWALPPSGGYCFASLCRVMLSLALGLIGSVPWGEQVPLCPQGPARSRSTSLVCLCPNLVGCVTMPRSPLSLQYPAQPIRAAVCSCFQGTGSQYFWLWRPKPMTVSVIAAQLCFVGGAAVDSVHSGGVALSQEKPSLQQAQAVLCCESFPKQPARVGVV